jgi:hypothetical protein
MPNHLPRHVVLSVLALAACFLASCTGTAVAAPKKPDRVLQAIAAAQKSGAMTAIQARRARLDWTASARAQRTARSGSRRAAVAAVRGLTTRLATRGQLTPDRVQSALLSVRATTWTMLHGSYPGHEQEVTIPGEPLVFTYYSGRGVQYQPFETFKEGMRALNQKTPDIDSARTIADRMLQLSQKRGTSRTWEYFFAFGGPERPWTSAISQALATEFYYRVGELVDEASRPTYTTAAEEITRSFLRAPGVGGVGVPEAGGRYYVMYSFAPSQRILNGHLQVLLNVNRYANATGSAAAKRVVALGRAAVLPLLPRFDTGGWSNYQPGQEAELGYHEFQSEQLVKLGEELPDTTLAEYGDRFESYLVTPPNLTFGVQSFPAVFPAADGLRDGIDVPVVIDKRSRLTLIVSDEAGAEVNRVIVTGSAGRRTVRWNGVDSKGARAAAGSYTGRLVATDIVGNRASYDLPSPLRVVADTTPPSVRLVALRERRGTSIVSVNAFDMASAWITMRLTIDGRAVAFGKGRRSGTTTLTTRRALADVKRGVLTLVDTSGNAFTYPLAQ